MKMTGKSPNRLKTLWEKEKLLETSNFAFSSSVYKRLVLQTRKNQGLFGKGLKQLLDSMYRCAGRRNITEILFKMVLNTIQSVSMLMYICTKHIILYKHIPKGSPLGVSYECLLTSNKQFQFLTSRKQKPLKI